MKEQHTKIPTSLIDDPKIVLRFVDTDAVEYHELKDSIRRFGVLMPLLVRSKGDKYEVVDGWYRLTAARELGLTHLPCTVREIPDELVLITQIQCNGVRHETENFEFAKALRKIVRDNKDLSLRQIAQMVGKSSAWVSNVLRLNLLTDKVMKLSQSGQIALSNAYKLANLPKALQEDFIEQAVLMKTKEFSALISKVIREVKDNKSNEHLKKMFKDLTNFRENPYPKMKPLSILEVQLNNFTKKRWKDIVKANGCKRTVDAFLAGIKYVMGMDKVSIESRARQLDKMEAEREKKRFKIEEFEENSKKSLDKPSE